MTRRIIPTITVLLQYPFQICLNYLCYATGQETAISPLTATCHVPLDGRYVSVQKFRSDPGSDWVLELGELDVTLFYSPS